MCNLPGLFLFIFIFIFFFKGWQAGVQEGAADWVEDWDKFEDDGMLLGTLDLGQHFNEWLLPDMIVFFLKLSWDLNKLQSFETIVHTLTDSEGNRLFSNSCIMTFKLLPHVLRCVETSCNFRGWDLCCMGLAMGVGYGLSWAVV